MRQQVVNLKRRFEQDAQAGCIPDQTLDSDVILILGNLKRWLESGRDLPDDPKLEFASFDDLDADLLLKLRPAFVLSPLIADNFDAHELAARLSQLGYQGQYRVSCPHLPRPEVVRRELLNANPALDVDIFHINALAPLEVV